MCILLYHRHLCAHPGYSRYLFRREPCHNHNGADQLLVNVGGAGSYNLLSWEEKQLFSSLTARCQRETLEYDYDIGYSWCLYCTLAMAQSVQGRS